MVIRSEVAGQTLTTDGSGNISWSAAGSGTISGSGTDNYIPRFNGTNALQDSAVYASDAGDLGFGTTSPSSTIHLANGRQIRIDKSGNAGRYTIYDYAGINTAPANDGFSIKLGGDTKFKFINDRLGIGNTSPAKALHIGDAANVTGNGTIRLQGYSAGGSGNYHDIVSYGDNLTFYRNSTMCLFLQYNGKVGIGTTAPADTLHVKASGSSGKIISDTTGTGGWTGYQLWINGVEKWGASAYENHFYIYDKDADAKRLVVMDTGKVGIGTDAPSQLLEVSTASGGSSNSYFDGALKVGGNSATSGGFIGFNRLGSGQLNFSSLNDDGGANSKIQFGFGAAIDGTPATHVMTLNQLGNVCIGTTSPDGTLHVETGSAGTITTEAYADDLIIENSDHVGIALRCPDAKDGFILFQSATNDRVARISAEYNGGDENLAFAVDDDDKMIINDSGNVGIGTTAPARKLHVLGGAVGVQARLSAPSGWGTGLEFYDGDTSGRHWRIGTSNNVAGDFTFMSGTSTGAAPTTTRVSILAGGSVGIGTATPTAPLEVRGADSGITISSASANRPHLRLVNGTTNMFQLSANGTYAAIGDGTDANRYMGFYAGKVGVNTIAPDANLDIKSAGDGNNVLLVRASDNDVLFNVRQSANDCLVRGYKDGGSQTWQIHSDGASYFNGGSVGIGTASPSKHLHIYSSTSTGIRLDRSGNYWDAKVSAAYGLQFNNGSDRIIFDANGNVGIGTTAPSTKLSVYTTTAVDGITLDGSIHPAMTFKGAGTIRGYLGIATGASGFITGTATGDIVLRSDGTKLFLGTTSAGPTLVCSGYDVGIGTTAPDQYDATGRVLEVEYSGDGFPALRIERVSGSSKTNRAWETIVGSAGNYAIKDATVNGDRLSIDTSGNATFSGSVRAEDRFDLYHTDKVWQLKNVSGTFSLRNGNTGAVPISITSAGAATFSGNVTLATGGSAAAPRLAFGDGNTGFFENGDNDLYITIGGTQSFIIEENSFYGANATGAKMRGNVAAAATTASFCFNSDSDTGIGRADANKLSLVAGGVGTATVTSTGVGIGTNAPAYKLDVAGDIRVGQGQSTGILHSGGDLQFYADGTKVIEMWTSGSDHIFKSFHDIAYFSESNVKVGLGTTSPEEKLHIAGTEAVIKLVDTAATSAGYVDFDGVALQLTTNRNPNTGAFADTSKSHANISLSGANGGSKILFYTANANNTTGTQRAVIEADGTLDLKSSKFKINGSGGTNGYTIVTDGSGNISWSSAGTGTVTGTGTANYVSKWTGTSSQGNSQIFDNGTTVGIGTNTFGSNSVLEIYKASGNHHLRIKAADNASCSIAFRNATGNEIYCGMFGEISGGINKFGIYNTGLHMVVDNTGKVGIGTTAPSRLFDVKSTTDDTAWIRASYSSTICEIGAHSAAAYLQSGSGDDIRIAPAGGTKLIVKVEGLVGIGTLTPAAILHVEKADDPIIAVTRGGTNIALLGDTGSSNGGDLLLYTGGSNTTRLRSTPNDHSWINTSSGANLGVGTSSPAAKLDVNGDVRIGNSTRGHYLGEKALTVNGTTYTTALTIVLSDHNAAHVKLFLTGDWSGHSAVAYVGEYFIQNGGGGYAEPGMIISEFDNTATDFIESKIVDPSTDTFTIQLKLSDSDNGSLGGHICYHVMGEVTSVT